jgi:hypothetical protein
MESTITDNNLSFDTATSLKLPPFRLDKRHNWDNPKSITLA